MSLRGVGKALISGSFDSQSDVFQQIAEFEETQCVCIHHKTVLLYFTQIYILSITTYCTYAALQVSGHFIRYTFWMVDWTLFFSSFFLPPDLS